MANHFLDNVTDMFPPEEKRVAKPKDTNLPDNLVWQSTGRAASRLVTQDFTLAVALLCAGWEAPDLTPIGHSKRGRLRVSFSFPMPKGHSQAAVEDKFLRKEMRAEVSRVFAESQSLKARIYRLSRSLDENAANDTGNQESSEPDGQ